MPFTEMTNVKNRTFLVSMDFMSLDTNIQQNEGKLKFSVTKHMKISTKTTPSHTLLAGNAYRLILKKISSTSMQSTTYKTVELQWAQRQQFWFLCQYFHDIYWNNNSKQNCLPVYGTWINQTSKPSLNKQTYITQLLNSRPKHLTLRLRF